MPNITFGSSQFKVLTDGDRLAVGFDRDSVILCESAQVRNIAINQERELVTRYTDSTGMVHHSAGVGYLQVDVSFYAMDASFHKGSLEEVFNKDVSVLDLFGDIARRLADR